jgi:hypothetical protein
MRMTMETGSQSLPVYEVEEKDEGYLQGFQDARDELMRRLAVIVAHEKASVEILETRENLPRVRAYRLGRQHLAEKLIEQLEPRVVAKFTGWCPGVEMTPNPCTCSCYGCKFHCKACWRGADVQREV